jgi:hypothetical protein
LWYRLSYVLTRTAGTIAPYFGTNAGVSRSADGTYTEYGLATTTAFEFAADAAFAGTVDTVVCQAMTLSEMIATVSLGTANAINGVVAVRTLGGRIGEISRVDSATTPANFLLAIICDPLAAATAKLFKCVAGTYTELITAAVTYSATARLVISCDGTAVRLYYANALVGTQQTVSDAGIVSNVIRGLFSTDPGNNHNDYLVMARGNGGEYAFLDTYIA